MHSYYEFSDVGREIIDDSGIDAIQAVLAEQLDEGELGEVLYSTCANELFYHHYTEEESTLKQAYSVGRLALDDFDLINTRSIFTSSLSTMWFQSDGRQESNGRLFPVDTFRSIAMTNFVDRVVFTGAIAQEYLDYDPVKGLLDNYSRYNFGTRFDSAIFVSAYILSSVVMIEQNILFTKQPPYFKIHSGEMQDLIELPPDLHGDFRIRRKRSYHKGVSSPANTSVEFSPVRELLISGYHSIEPVITACMIRNIRENNTDGEAFDKINQLVSVAKEHLDNEQMWPDMVFYGDYGTGVNLGSYALQNYARPRENRNSSDSTVFFVPCFPQSEVRFVVSSDINGISIFNRDSNSNVFPDDDDRILIPAEYFPDMFRILLQQAGRGDGRTSVAQHLQFLEAVISEINR